jgi:hypothetical protein
MRKRLTLVVLAVGLAIGGGFLVKSEPASCYGCLSSCYSRGSWCGMDCECLCRGINCDCFEVWSVEAARKEGWK